MHRPSNVGSPVLQKLKLLGIQVQHGYSPEARVFATLLGNRQGSFEATVLHQHTAQDRSAADTFAHASVSRVRQLDFGWRRHPPLPAAIARRVAGRLRYRVGLHQATRAATAYAPDVIYSNQQKWDCDIATRLAEKLHRPQIIHLHYTVGPWLGRQVLHRLLSCEHVITVSDFIREEAFRHGVLPHRVATVLNPMPVQPLPSPQTRQDVRYELGVPADATFVGIVARIDRFKGHHDTVAAFARIAARHGDARLAIVGDGDQRSAIQAQIQQAGLS